VVLLGRVSSVEDKVHGACKSKAVFSFSKNILSRSFEILLAKSILILDSTEQLLLMTSSCNIFFRSNGISSSSSS
jgi:hypothetical protein